MVDRSALPPNMEPICVSLQEAAALMGLSVNIFKREVEAGTIPQPLQQLRTQRKLWSVAAIRAAVDNLNGGGHGKDPWMQD